MRSRLTTICGIVALSLIGTSLLTAEDALARWRESVRIRPVVPDTVNHTIHSYFNTSPESPDGRFVLYYASRSSDGEAGELRILDRTSGEVKVIASDIITEDAHRAACQQWVNGGKTIVYHDFRNGRWHVIALDVSSLKKTVLASDRQVGFGSCQFPWIPVYGCHWNPGPHRDLELIHVETGEIQKVVTADQVIQEYGDWVQKRFASKEISIFFPVLSSDGEKVFFKIARPSGGNNFRSKQASVRDGLVVYDLADKRLVRLIEKWGHPSWSPTSKSIFEIGNVLIDVETGQTKRYAPSCISNHPSISPDGRLFVTDADVTNRPFGKPEHWAIAVGSASKDEFEILTLFDNRQGAKTWRHNHPHPAFSPDGNRIYFNVNDTPWTRLFVAETAVSNPGPQ